jgi:undecaprenyl diphosphate synthase
MKFLIGRCGRALERYFIAMIMGGAEGNLGALEARVGGRWILAPQEGVGGQGPCKDRALRANAVFTVRKACGSDSSSSTSAPWKRLMTIFSSEPRSEREQRESRLAELSRSLKRERLPNHVAIIMDGNGRWAKQLGRPRVFGHRRGVETVRSIVETADRLGVKVLSLYAFSEENWGRPAHEVTTIMTLMNTYLLRNRDELHEKNVQLRTMGRLERLPPKTLKLVRESEDLLRDNTGLVLNIALSYGGRTEIVEACRAVARRVQSGELSPQDINHDVLGEGFATWDLPDPDLLIRTSGEQRLSNFMLWQMAYTEFHFTPVHWPDFGEEQFLLALQDYAHRQRRFGLVQDDPRELATEASDA